MSTSTVSSLLVASATVLAAAATSLPANDSSKPGEKEGECQLLGPFSIIIQGALGILALFSLVYKRWRERPQRPLKIWAFDALKQVVGSALLHLANLFMSMVSSGALTVSPSGKERAGNPCSFYLLNLAIDTTLGIPILIGLLRLVTVAAMKTPLAKPPESIKSGYYGDPPKATWWLKQCLLYFIGLLGMKLCVFFIFKICPWIIYVGDWALRWTEGNTALQIAFVMLIFPVIMNALQYYIIDSFIKEKDDTRHEAVPTEDEDEEEAQSLHPNWEASFEIDEDEEDIKKSTELQPRDLPSSSTKTGDVQTSINAAGGNSSDESRALIGNRRS